MAATNACTAIVCTGTTTVPGPIHVSGIFTKATTSYTISDGTTTICEGTNGVGYEQVELKADSLTVTVTGGGYVTLFLRTN